jgi:hypothetical protein
MKSTILYYKNKLKSGFEYILLENKWASPYLTTVKVTDKGIHSLEWCGISPWQMVNSNPTEANIPIYQGRNTAIGEFPNPGNTQLVLSRGKTM